VGPAAARILIGPAGSEGDQLQGSFSHTFQNWEKVVSMLAARQINLEPVISRVAGLEEWRGCFDGMYNGEYVKAVMAHASRGGDLSRAFDLTTAVTK
jgi:alcohol dehydrogenase/L-iditol 2-dehydrogenase